MKDSKPVEQAVVALLEAIESILGSEDPRRALLKSIVNLCMVYESISPGSQPFSNGKAGLAPITRVSHLRVLK